MTFLNTVNIFTQNLHQLNHGARDFPVRLLPGEQDHLLI